MSKLPTLQPCRFCNFEKTSVRARSRELWKDGGRVRKSRYHIQCNKCFAGGPHANTVEQAAEAWGIKDVSEA